MSVYLTKSMLTKLNKVEYPSTSFNEDQKLMDGNNDQWQRIYTDFVGNREINLAKEMICRVCAKNGCTPLMDKLLDHYDIMSAITTITNVSISIDDPLPKYICLECLMSLRVAMDFKKNCEINDKKFKKMVDPIDESTHLYPYSKNDFSLILHKMKLRRLKIEEHAERKRQRIERLRNMKKKPHSREKDKFKCSPCDIAFPNKDKLVEHRRERQCTRRTCELCGLLVLNLSQHRRLTHRAAAAHVCPTCGKEFRFIARLKAHMLVHSDTFSFFCDLCPYKCKHKYYLVMHMRTHTGEKPYKCPACPATFVNPSNLNKHKLTHQEKQIKCPVCDKSFRTAPTLREHQQAAHLNIKHTCTLCGRDFCYRSDLRKHEIRMHNRVKRELGGEPSYKQVERMQKVQENAATDMSNLSKWQHDAHERHEETKVLNLPKWQHERHDPQEQHDPHEDIAIEPPKLVQTTYVEGGKEYVYYAEMPAILQSGSMPQIVTVQQPVHVMHDMSSVKKDDTKMYEVPQPTHDMSSVKKDDTKMYEVPQPTLEFY